jgi:hypothetical protein
MKPNAFFLLFLGLSVPKPALPSVVIHEVLYDATGADAPHVFTELFGEAGLSLEGWSLLGLDGASGLAYRTLDLTGAVIPSDGLLVIATARAIGELLLVRDFVADVDWQNGPDALVLRNPLLEIVDALQYGDAGAVFLGEGTPASDPPAGLSLTRDGRSTDRDDNSVDFEAAEPTPGHRAVPVSEPSSALLLLAGLGGALGRVLSLLAMQSLMIGVRHGEHHHPKPGRTDETPAAGPSGAP